MINNFDKQIAAKKGAVKVLPYGPPEYIKVYKGGFMDGINWCIDKINKNETI